MAKEKTKAGTPNKYLHARIAFLQQASAYLAGQGGLGKPSMKGLQAKGLQANEVPNADIGTTSTKQEGTATSTSEAKDIIPFSRPSSGGLPLHLSAHLTQVARKSQIRLSPDVKHRLCKRCCAVLVDGSTSRDLTENLSKDGNKAHADVRVRECRVCGAKKRWPVGATRQPKKKARIKT